MSEIHATAVIAPGAVIGQDCIIGAYSIIGPKVVLGSGNRVGPHVVIEGRTTLGDSNAVFQFASVGSAPQDLKFRGEDSALIIGSENVIREYVTLQPGTANGNMRTLIGDRNLFMANCHVGHDAVVGSGNVFANSCALAGHVEVGDSVTIGGLCGVHQFCRLGDLSILGAGSMVPMDVPPFCMVQGDRARLAGLNKIGLERHGFSEEQVLELKRAYKWIFGGKGKFSERLASLEGRFPGELVARFAAFLNSGSSRGIVFPRKRDDPFGD